MSKTTLLASAAIIKAETSPRANTATRVGTMFEDIINEAVPYKVYKALLTQTGTNAPVATVLVNTLGGTPVWSYDSEGAFEVEGDAAFDIEKINYKIGNIANGIISCAFDTGKLKITTSLFSFGAFNLVNGVLDYTPFEIEIYP